MEVRRYHLPPGAESIEVRITERLGLVYLEIIRTHGQVRHGSTECLTDHVNVDLDRHGCLHGIEII